MILVDKAYLHELTQGDAAQLRSENCSLRRWSYSHSSTRKAMTNPFQNPDARGEQTESEAGGKAHLH